MVVVGVLLDIGTDHVHQGGVVPLSEPLRAGVVGAAKNLVHTHPFHQCLSDMRGEICASVTGQIEPCTYHTHNSLKYQISCSLGFSVLDGECPHILGKVVCDYHDVWPLGHPGASTFHLVLYGSHQIYC